MKISKVRGPKIPHTGIKNKKIDETSQQFADQLRGAAATDELAPAAEGIAAGGVESVLALQEVPDSTDKRSRAMYRDYGRDLLDRLDQLRMGILAGVFSKDRLAAVSYTHLTLPTKRIV